MDIQSSGSGSHIQSYKNKNLMEIQSQQNSKSIYQKIIDSNNSKNSQNSNQMKSQTYNSSQSKGMTQSDKVSYEKQQEIQHKKMMGIVEIKGDIMINSDPLKRRKDIPTQIQYPQQQSSNIESQHNNTYQDLKKIKQIGYYSCLYKRQSRNKTKVCQNCKSETSICDQQKCNIVCLKYHKQRMEQFVDLCLQKKNQSNSTAQYSTNSEIYHSSDILPLNHTRQQHNCNCLTLNCSTEKCMCFLNHLKCTQTCRCIKEKCKNLYNPIRINIIPPNHPQQLLSSLSSNGTVKSQLQFDKTQIKPVQQIKTKDIVRKRTKIFKN